MQITHWPNLRLTIEFSLNFRSSKWDPSSLGETINCANNELELALNALPQYGNNNDNFRVYCSVLHQSIWIVLVNTWIARFLDRNNFSRRVVCKEIKKRPSLEEDTKQVKIGQDELIIGKYFDGQILNMDETAIHCSLGPNTNMFQKLDYVPPTFLTLMTRRVLQHWWQWLVIENL